MISLIFEDRCTACNECVIVCPRDVFDPCPGNSPEIARPDDCQTCFLCELYCQADAIYVAPESDSRLAGTDLAVAFSGELRRESGWDEWADDPARRNQHWRMEDVFKRARGQ
ncbi:4Fe-4S dicluster domain-containing protein [Komagataeibacter oboediens]|uniref:4Fe-4S dicluster domain-containing protein n=1 Tax=Komagataeibacter oboediens TaxID=65958 RepID=UPI001C2D8A7C|nr:ferredoxin family protein [Komagataeibacter oboediens]MBV1825406.1 ferredoxin family protein [Komagataeibacter oboediens]